MTRRADEESPSLIVDKKLLGTSSVGRIHPDRSRMLLLMIRPARPTLAEVPLADLFFAPHEARVRLPAAWIVAAFVFVAAVFAAATHAGQSGTGIGNRSMSCGPATQAAIGHPRIATTDPHVGIATGIR